MTIEPNVAPPRPQPPASPPWSLPVKMLVAALVLAAIAGLVIRFNELVGPVLFCFILAYLLSPIANWFSERLRVSWAAGVNLTFLLLLLLLIGLLTVAGIAIEQQVVGLYRAMLRIVNDLPGFLASVEAYLSQPVIVGPFNFSLATVELQPLIQQIVSGIQPALSQAGGAVGSLATGTASSVGWALFVLLISYYLMHDLRSILPELERVAPKGYDYDVRRLAGALGPIWDAYLRGQVTLALIVGLMIGLGLMILDVRYAPILGLLAVVAEFIPYIGPISAAVVGVLVALFQQRANWLGLDPFWYAAVVALVYLVMQQIQGSIIYPRIMGRSLDLHPVIILVGALVMAQLMGFVGLLLAAPLLATVKLFGQYVYRKLLDLDPWPERPPPPPAAAPAIKWPRWLRLPWLNRPKPPAG